MGQSRPRGTAVNLRKSRSSSYLAAALTPPAREAGPEQSPPSSLKVYRVRVRLPDEFWFGRFGRYHPETVIEVLNVLDLHSGKVISEIRLHTLGPGPWDDEVRIMADVDDVEVLRVDPTYVHLRVTHRTLGVLRILRDLRLTVTYPYTVLGGEAWWVVVTSEDRLRALIQRFTQDMAGVTLESIRIHASSESGDLLTPRQRELLLHAIRAGYFQVPRKISLRDLAAQEGLAASSLSQALAVAEKKILEAWPFGTFSSSPTNVQAN